MPRPVKQSATSTAALERGTAPTQARLSTDAMGASGDRATLNRLNAAVGELKALAIQPLLQNAVNALRKDDHQAGAEWAIKALEQDERSGFGWYMLAIARELAGDFKGSITCYEAAIALLPDHAELGNNLGRLAFRLGQPEVAERLFRHFLARFPDHPEGANNLACALRSQSRFDEAIEVLKPALTKDPRHPMVWNTLGTVMAEQGDPVNAQIFFDEALRQDAGFAKARYNRGNMRMAIGEIAAALEDCDTALSQTVLESERQMMRLARSTILINLGRIGEGWDDYEARLHPQFADCTQFLVERPRWEPGMDLAGKSLLVIGEQGLGDEILFANQLPDIIEALGPEGRLTLAVEPRLVSLFQRSFPQAEVGRHNTYSVEGRTVRAVQFLSGRMDEIDLWTPIGSALRQFRRSVDDFPVRDRYMIADPVRVAHWREVLKTAPAGKKVGLLWKSAIASAGRHRYFSPFEQWAPILATPGVCFVNLQYGDCSEEIEQARRDFGVEIWTPPGIDLKQDLDDLAALSCALDLVVGFANATSNIAAACGAPCWMVSTPGAWPRVGTDRYPWYPQMRVFQPPAFREWEPVMAQVAQALAEFAAS
ncbi:tetratricopeptide repeat protein [Phenylobacterium sp.]|uniref:tetratricopeptide repeat-containing glycosyltransferase family protein n=1 Tax=Phenylobacterium sp. TaxID=1871053 RepID=UPI003BAD6502